MVDVRVPTLVTAFWCLASLGVPIGTLVVLHVDPLGDSIVTLVV